MANPPSLELSFSPAGPQFAITEQCEMPSIAVTANFKNVTPDPKLPLQFRWKVTLVFTGGNCAHSQSRIIKHPEINQVTPIGTLTIPFTQIRGGSLTVAVTVAAGPLNLAAESKGLEIVGTNPSVPALLGVCPKDDAFKKLMRLESGLRQFRAPGCPLFSGDNLGGVGICQITQPRPTDDQVWSWKENLAAGLALYRQKEAIARAYPNTVRNSAAFKTQVKAYNDARAAAINAKPKTPGTAPAAVKELMIEVPDYTADQLQRDTLRGFNGYAGGLHQYRLKTDADGLLVVTENPNGSKGTAEWEEIRPADRNAYYDRVGIAQNRRGDPNYVNDVEAQASF